MMIRLGKIIIWVFLFILFAVALGRVLSMPVIYSDFMSLYHAVLGWRGGASFYDFALQQKLILETNPEISINLYPYFPYPPWYGGTLFFLAWLPYEWAYRTWMILNLGMLAVIAHLLIEGQTGRTRILALSAIIFYLPSIGLIVVGNYTLPVLLGGALFIYAARKEDPLLAAGSLGLMTFKPHIGFLMALTGFIWLFNQKSSFAIRARWMTLVAGLILIGIGFAVEPQWPLTFPKSIITWQTSSYIRACEYCSSAASMVRRLAGGQGGPISSIGISAALFLLAGLLVWIRHKYIFEDAEKMMSVAAAYTAFVLPYIVNYDFVILMIPLAYLFTHNKDRKIRILLIFIYLLPWLSLFFDRVTGNVILTLSGLVLFLFLCAPAPVTERRR